MLHRLSLARELNAPRTGSGLAMQAPLQCMQIKDASIRHSFRIGFLLEVPLYLAAAYPVDYSAKHGAFYLFLWELKHLSQCLDPWGSSLADESPRCQTCSLMGTAASEPMLGCLAGGPFSSGLALGLLTGRSSSKEPKGFHLFAICFLDVIYFLLIYDWENSLSPKRELNVSLLWIHSPFSL